MSLPPFEMQTPNLVKITTKIHHHLNQLQMWINGTKITVPGYQGETAVWMRLLYSYLFEQKKKIDESLKNQVLSSFLVITASIPHLSEKLLLSPQLTFFSSFQQEVSPHISRRVYNRNINRAPNKTYKQGNFIGQVLCLNLCGLFKVHHDPVVAACSSSRVSLAVPVTSSIPFKVLEQAIIG